MESIELSYGRLSCLDYSAGSIHHWMRGREIIRSELEISGFINKSSFLLLFPSPPTLQLCQITLHTAKGTYRKTPPLCWAAPSKKHLMTWNLLPAESVHRGKNNCSDGKCCQYKFNYIAHTHSVLHIYKIFHTVVFYSLILGEIQSLPKFRGAYHCQLASSFNTKIVELQQNDLTKRKHPARHQLCKSAVLHHPAPLCQISVE